MKMKYWISSFLMFLCISVLAQKSDLPKRVAKTFDSKFPGIENVKWNVEKGDYKIKFDYNGKKTVVEIDGDGTWEKTSTHLLFDELPAEVKTTVNEKTVNAEISELKKVIDDEDDLYYRIDLIEGSKKIKLWVDEKGKITRSEAEDMTLQ